MDANRLPAEIELWMKANRQRGFSPNAGDLALDTLSGLVCKVDRREGVDTVRMTAVTDERMPLLRIQRRLDSLAPVPEDLWSVTASFSNGDEAYAVATFKIAAMNEVDSEVVARFAAGLLNYDDDRIPDRHIGLSIEPCDGVSPAMEQQLSR